MGALYPVAAHGGPVTVLDLSGVTKSFGGVTAVRGVGLRVEPQSRTAIVGPSGCGKTTLMRLIAGFEAPDAGRIALGDRMLADATGSLPAHKRGIGLVAQDGALFPHLTVAENIGFGLPASDTGREAAIARLADFVGLSHRALHRHPHEVSGGQQQRVALARAMARKPVLMLLDEPFSSLDTGLRIATCGAVIDLLTEARIASILVTHDQAEALAYGDQIAVMHEGTLTQTGAPQTLYLHPKDRRTAEFLGEAVILRAAVADGIARCLLGSISASGPAGEREIMLRPEQIRLRPPEGATAEVIAVEFHGATSVVIVGFSDPARQTLRLRQPSVLLPTPGDRVGFEVIGAAHGLEDG